MSWVTDKAVKRIFSTFKRLGKQIYKEDIDALKTINDALELQKKQNIDNNMLFAITLYLLIKERLRKGQSINTALYMIGHDLRSFDLVENINQLTAIINVNELQQFMKDKEVVIPKGKDIYNDTDELLDLWHKQYDKEFLDKILESWTFDEVKKSFENTVNEIIQNYQQHG